MESTFNNYEPFGTEWANEMMKLKKADIIEMFKNKCIESKSLAIKLITNEGKKPKQGTQEALGLSDVIESVCNNTDKKCGERYENKCLSAGVCSHKTVL